MVALTFSGYRQPVFWYSVRHYGSLYLCYIFYCERWPRHQQVVCIYREPLSTLLECEFYTMPCDLYTGGVITHRAHRELKRIMRFVNKRRPYWQRATHSPQWFSLTSVCACVSGCVHCVSVGFVPPPPPPPPPS